MTVIRVQMTSGKIEAEPFPADRIVGGRGMIDYLMTKYSSPTTHPLSEHSYFIVAPGLLAGTNAPNSGRLSVGGKSPLTGTIKEANVGGTAGHKLGRLGIKAIMITGKASGLRILKIDDVGATLENGSYLEGLSNYQSCEQLRKRYGERIGIIITGPAGEMRLSNSTVAVTDLEGRPSRHAARGGMGAVMAAKGLKAIVVEDSRGEWRKAVDKEGFKAAVKAATDDILSMPDCQNLSKVGTPGWIDNDHAHGSLPTFNYRAGAFDKYQNINGNKIVELSKSRGGKMGHSCMLGCVVHCSHVFHGPDGKFVTSALEYETIAMLGSNLGIDDIDVIAQMDRRCDDLGLDTIEMGAAIGVLNDVGLFQFGDAAKAQGCIEEVAQGTPLGRILGSGAAFTAQAFGIDRVPAVKGQAIPGHTGRSVKGLGVTYATSPQGADHTAGPATAYPLSAEGQAKRSRMAQIQMAALDSSGICFYTFIFFKPGVIVSMVNALYGLHWSKEDYLAMGKEMLRQEIEFNRKAGIALEGNGLPGWLREEPLPPTGAVFDVLQEDIEKVFDF